LPDIPILYAFLFDVGQFRSHIFNGHYMLRIPHDPEVF